MKQQQEQLTAYTLAGIFTLSLRLIVGWTYFSAFWRRLVLENKLIPDSTGYIGEKFNHFLPNSIGIKPIIEYLVSTPDLLWWAELPLSIKRFSKVAIGGAAILFILTLYTNQVFHNGVWGPLHNKSVKPKIEISDANVNNGALSFKVYRVEGADVYGSFLIGITLKDTSGKVILQKNGEDLALFPLTNIKNDYIAKVVPGKHSLIIPLGSKATLAIRDNSLQNLPEGQYELILTDISGITWNKNITIE